MSAICLDSSYYRNRSTIYNHSRTPQLQSKGLATGISFALGTNDQENANQFSDVIRIHRSSTTGQNSFTASSVNLLKNCIGAGIFTLNSCISSISADPIVLIQSITLVYVMALWATYNFYIVGETCKITRSKNFADAWSKSVSPASSWVVQFIVTIAPLVTCLANTIVLTDIVSVLSRSAFLPSWFYSNRACVIAVLVIFILFPLCTLKDLSSLQSISLVGLAGHFTAMGVLLIRWLDNSYAKFTGIHYEYSAISKAAVLENIQTTTGEALSSIGFVAMPSGKWLILASLLSYCYVTHYNAPRYYHELSGKEEDPDLFIKMTLISYLSAASIYTTTILLTYLLFGNNSAPFSLNSLSPHDPLCLLCLVAFGTSVLASYPLVFLNVRNFFVKQAARFVPLLGNIYAVSAILLAMLAYIATYCSDIGLVGSIAGAIFGTSMMFIFPPIMYIRALYQVVARNKETKSDDDNEGEDGSIFRVVLLNLLLLFTGTLIGILGTNSDKNMFTGEKGLELNDRSEIEIKDSWTDMRVMDAFTANKGGTEFDAVDNSRLYKFAVNASWLVNWFLLGAKLYAVIVSSSKAVTAALVDSIVDLLSQAILAMADRYIAKRSPEYPVGRSRLEALSVIACAFIMSMASIEVMQYSATDLYYGINGDLPKLNIPTSLYIILGMGIVMKFFLWLFCAHVNRTLQSDSVTALAEDHFNDVISNIAAIITAAIAFHTIAWWVDPTGAILISFVIIARWVGIISEQVKKIVGHTAPPEYIEMVEQLALSHDSRLYVDCTRVYHFGVRYNVEMEIVLPGAMTVRESHDIALALQHKIEGLDEVERAFVHVDFEKRDGLEHKVERDLVKAAAVTNTTTTTTLLSSTELRSRSKDKLGNSSNHSNNSNNNSLGSNSTHNPVVQSYSSIEDNTAV